MNAFVPFDRSLWDDEQLRRVKTVSVPVRVIICWLYGQSQLPDYVSIPAFGQIPATAKIIRAEINVAGMFIDVILSDSSFDVVPEGGFPPRLDGDLIWNAYALATPEELSARVYRETPTVIG